MMVEERIPDRVLRFFLVLRTPPVLVEANLFSLNQR
jgi:hypothetical protein